MHDQDEQERLRLLCEQASREHDPARLLELTEEIVGVLKKKEQRLKERNTTAA